MKTSWRWFGLLLLAGLLACGGAEEDPTQGEALKLKQGEAAEKGISCRLQLAIECPEGQIDGCLVGLTEVHRCVVAQPPVVEPTPPCPDGTCTPGNPGGGQDDPDTDDPPAAPSPCDQGDTQSVILCPEGQVDGCLIGATNVHECVPGELPPVKDPKPPSCRLLLAAICPDGYVDACIYGAEFHECVPERKQ